MRRPVCGEHLTCDSPDLVVCSDHPACAEAPGHRREDRPSEASRPELGSTVETANAEDTLWFALCMAPEDGTEVGELIRSPE